MKGIWEKEANILTGSVIAVSQRKSTVSLEHLDVDVVLDNNLLFHYVCVFSFKPLDPLTFNQMPTWFLVALSYFLIALILNCFILEGRKFTNSKIKFLTWWLIKILTTRKRNWRKLLFKKKKRNYSCGKLTEMYRNTCKSRWGLLDLENSRLQAATLLGAILSSLSVSLLGDQILLNPQRQTQSLSAHGVLVQLHLGLKSLTFTCNFPHSKDRILTFATQWMNQVAENPIFRPTPIRFYQNGVWVWGRQVL